MQTILALLYVVISLIGMADAAYITYTEYLDPAAMVQCGAGFDCGTVLHSQFAHIGPVPLSALGFLFYLTVFSFAILHFLKIKVNPSINMVANKLDLAQQNFLRSITTFKIIQILTIFGALFSVYLLFLMAFIIEAWCQFCLISAATSLSLFIVTLVYSFLNQGLLKQTAEEVGGNSSDRSNPEHL